MRARRNPAAAMIAAALLAACASAPAPAPEPQRYSGVLRQWFEGQSFHADGETAPWAFGMTLAAMRELSAAYPEDYAPGAFGPTVVVDVEGVLTRANPDAFRYGPIGNYEYYLTITRVVDARLLRVACERALVHVFFGVNDAAIGETSAAILDEAVRQSRRNACNVSRVSIVGHTDTVGSARDNQALSQRRADAVRDALVARGMPAELVIAEGAGEGALLRPTADNVAEALNRYVTITIEAPRDETR